MTIENGSGVTTRLRPTSLLPFVVWAGLLFLHLTSPSQVSSALLVGLSTMLLVGYAWARSLRDHVTGQRQVFGTWVVAGDRLREQFTLVNDGWLPVLWAQVRDYSEVPGYRADRVESVDGHGERVWTRTGICQRRGVFRLGPWELHMADPLGFFEVIQHHPETTTIMVYPRAAHLPQIELPRGRAPGREASSERSAIETVRVGGVRPYVAGDSLRRVHWLATAHHNRLMVREFDREPSGDVWLVVDLDAEVQAGQEAEATQEYAVILAASLAARFTRGGERRAVGLCLSGRKPILLPPGRGQAQLWRILEALATAEPMPGTPFSVLLEQIGPSLGNGRTVVLITPSQDPAWVAPLLPLIARGNAPTAMLLDATTFSPPRGEQRALVGLRGLLAQQRIPSYVIAQGFPFQPLDRIRRQRQVFKTLAGTGRVIQVVVEEEV